METNEDFLRCFEIGILKTAEFITWLTEYKKYLEQMSNITGDNGDPKREVVECLARLGILLSVLTIYKDDYTKEPWKTKKHIKDKL